MNLKGNKQYIMVYYDFKKLFVLRRKLLNTPESVSRVSLSEGEVLSTIW